MCLRFINNELLMYPPLGDSVHQDFAIGGMSSLGLHAIRLEHHGIDHGVRENHGK